jgi:hypothetical protein
MTHPPAYEVPVSLTWTRLWGSAKVAPLGMVVWDDLKTRYHLLGGVQLALEHRHNDWVYAVFTSCDVSLRMPATLGAMFGARHRAGWGGYAGPLIDISRHSGVFAEVSWFVFSLEVQRRGSDRIGAATSMLLGLTVPLFITDPL